jgi:hypothetical protein
MTIPRYLPGVDGGEGVNTRYGGRAATVVQVPSIPRIVNVGPVPGTAKPPGLKPGSTVGSIGTIRTAQRGFDASGSAASGRIG